MNDRMRTGLLAAAFLILGAVAVWGWMRKPAPAYANANPNWAVPATNAMAPIQPMTGQPMPSQPMAYDADGRPMVAAASYPQPCVSDIAYTPAPAYASRNYVRTIRQEVPVESRYVERAPARTYYKKRSTKNSAMIVAGGAGAGAAIGALAGGGKGAAIGALTGGVGGFIYDRLTHKKRVN